MCFAPVFRTPRSSSAASRDSNLISRPSSASSRDSFEIIESIESKPRRRKMSKAILGVHRLLIIFLCCQGEYLSLSLSLSFSKVGGNSKIQRVTRRKINQFAKIESIYIYISVYTSLYISCHAMIFLVFFLFLPSFPSTFPTNGINRR